ncbi:hypothetical protein SAMN04487770_13127 [Butyrivibrio sp. ob235]|uniref:helix-turn-helix domain-containing protein n=1 Tax=Butyrivibrio sp. ob235 TaxID=1761780 RepID=UPI0008C0C765|nr:helix-turn-helix transcriptional regulator [Butyrivibrio sp. ob235]SEM26603.1 hypothetical protein SAMN04487770_13127 [Butyrivibrio sp. ob235]
MTTFINNINAYLDQMKIKQTYISKVTGIEKNKLSRILSGKQEIGESDMETLSVALGKNVAFFVSDSFCVPQISSFAPNKIAFYAGEPNERQEAIANDLVELMENVDQVLSAKSRFENVARISDV